MSDHDEHDNVSMCNDCGETEEDCDCEWHQVYAEHEFHDFCGKHQHLQKYKNWHFYLCWGGGPEGGFIINEETGEVCEVDRTWGQPFSVNPCEGMTIEFEHRHGVPQIRLVPRH